MEMLRVLLLLLFLSSCTIQKQPKILITHVLAVTEQGETRRGARNMITENVGEKERKYGTDQGISYKNDGKEKKQVQKRKPIYAPGNNEK